MVDPLRQAISSLYALYSNSLEDKIKKIIPPVHGLWRDFYFITLPAAT